MRLSAFVQEMFGYLADFVGMFAVDDRFEYYFSAESVPGSAVTVIYVPAFYYRNVAGLTIEYGDFGNNIRHFLSERTGVGFCHTAYGSRYPGQLL